MKKLRTLGFVIVAACTMTLVSCMSAEDAEKLTESLEKAGEDLKEAGNDAVDNAADAADEHTCEAGKCDGGEAH